MQKNLHPPALIPILAAAALLIALCESLLAGPRVVPAGEYILPRNAPEGLSGITWTGRNNYSLIEDSFGTVYSMEILADLESGAITNAAFTDERKISGIRDGEGIAFDSRQNMLYISDEAGPKIVRTCLHGDDAPVVLTTPGIFRKMRGNKALEALAYDNDSGILWTAAEDAMEGDGEISSPVNEAITRVFAFATDSGDLRLSSDYRYRLDRAYGRKIPVSSAPEPFGGLVSIAAVSTNMLLVLERSCGLVGKEDGLGGEGLITSSLFAVSTAGVSQGTLLEKELLWRHVSPASNYEGMALGPRLADGSRLLVLVADGDKSSNGRFTFQWTKALYSLRFYDAE